MLLKKRHASCLDPVYAAFAVVLNVLFFAVFGTFCLLSAALLYAIDFLERKRGIVR